MSSPRAAVAAVVTLVLPLAVGAALADDGPGTSVTIYQPPTPAQMGYSQYGGYGYGASAWIDPATGQAVTPPEPAAVVVQRGHADVPAGEGEVVFSGVAATIDAATARVKSLTDPSGTVAVQQRFAHDVADPDALLTRYVGSSIVAVTADGEVAGTLRSFDRHNLVIDTGSGSHPVQILSRDGYVRDIRFGKLAGRLFTEPSLVWRMRSKKAGRHLLEVTYRADGLSWSADYTAIYDPKKKTVDLTAWATIANETGTRFSDADVVLVSGPLEPPEPVHAAYGAYGSYAPAAPSHQTRRESFDVVSVAELPSGGTVQVELFPALAGAPARRVIVYEPMQDWSASYQAAPNTECYSYQQPTNQRAEMIEVKPSGGTAIPPGTLRLFRRDARGLTLLGQSDVSPGESKAALRVPVGGATEAITGTRRQLDCRVDHRTRKIHEKIEITVENASKKRRDVVVREYMQRWRNWTIEKESVNGDKVSSSAHEYRVRLAPGAKKTIRYSVVYTW